jgi:hypothetical protein
MQNSSKCKILKSINFDENRSVFMPLFMSHDFSFLFPLLVCFRVFLFLLPLLVTSFLFLFLLFSFPTSNRYQCEAAMGIRLREKRRLG